MSETAPPSEDTLKLCTSVLFIGIVFPLTLVGIILPIILFGGLYVAIRAKNLEYIKATTIISHVMVTLAAFLFLLVNYGNFYYEPYLAIFFVGFFVTAFIIEFLWFEPVLRRFPSLLGAYEARRLAKTEHQTILKREAGTAYSTAEELRRWHELLKDGAISESEYQEARKKILYGG